MTSCILCPGQSRQVCRTLSLPLFTCVATFSGCLSHYRYLRWAIRLGSQAGIDGRGHNQLHTHCQEYPLIVIFCTNDTCGHLLKDSTCQRHLPCRSSTLYPALQFWPIFAKSWGHPGRCPSYCPKLQNWPEAETNHIRVPKVYLLRSCKQFMQPTKILIGCASDIKLCSQDTAREGGQRIAQTSVVGCECTGLAECWKQTWINALIQTDTELE